MKDKKIPVSISITMSYSGTVIKDEDNKHQTLEELVQDQILLPNDYPQLDPDWIVDNFTVIKDDIC